METPLPSSIDTEKTILASCIISGNALNICVNKLLPEHFYDSQCKLIFQTLTNMYAKDISIDLPTLNEHIPQNDKIENIEYFISSLDSLCPTTPNPTEHIKIIKEKFRLRELIKLGATISSKGFMEVDSEEIFSFIERGLCPIMDTKISYESETVHIKDLIMPGIERLFSKEIFNGVFFGIDSIDKKIGGLRSGELAIIAGRPSMGKSAIMNNIAAHCEKPVLIFSLEMTKDALMNRFFSSECKVNASNIRSQELSLSEKKRLTRNCTPMSKKNIFINDNPSLNVYQIRSIAHNFSKKYNIGLIIVDYLQKIRDIGTFSNKRHETAEKSAILKNISKELNVPVISLAQLSRACEQRPDKRPFMSDIREAGEIEQDADMIAFIYRPYVYRLSEDPGETEFIIAKQREGETGIRKIKFVPQFLTFEDYPEVSKEEQDSF